MTPAILILALAPMLAAASINTETLPGARELSIAGRAAFCADHADLCTASGAETVADTAALRADLQAINAEINASIRYVATPDSRWLIAPAAGDCNDFAVTKLARLVAAGLPRRALRLAVLQVGQPTRALNGDIFNFFSWHMVLTVETTTGTLVLDSLSDAVTPWRSDDGRVWYALETDRAGLMTFVKLRTENDRAFEEVR